MDERLEIEALESSLRAVDAVASVVHAVWALARAQLPRVEQAVAEGTEYLDEVDAVVHRLAGAPRETEHAGALTIVLGPERAFSGALARRMVDHAPEAGAIGIVGARLADVVRREPSLASRVVFELAGPSSVDELPEASERLAEAVLAHGEGAPVGVVHPRGTRGVRRAVLLAMEREPRAQVPELYSPWERVVSAAVRESVTGRLRVALAESLAAEVRARVAATERARRAADERRAALEQSWRVGQRERVTRELTELVAGLRAS